MVVEETIESAVLSRIDLPRRGLHRKRASAGRKWVRDAGVAGGDEAGGGRDVSRGRGTLRGSGRGEAGGAGPGGSGAKASCRARAGSGAREGGGLRGPVPRPAFAVSAVPTSGERMELPGTQ